MSVVDPDFVNVHGNGNPSEMLSAAFQTTLIPGTTALEIVLHADAGVVDTRQRHVDRSPYNNPYPYTFEMLDNYPAGVGVGFVGDNTRVMKTNAKKIKSLLIEQIFIN